MFRHDSMHCKLKEIKEKAWLGRMQPVRILENVYFVGTYQASCHLIDTGDGLIMIDPGYIRTACYVIDSIYKLGFKPEDIKYIINTHWHGDHTEATADFANLFGAKTLLGIYDVEKAAKYFTPDITVCDGDKLTLGNTTVEFMHTPGHTKGTISPFFNTTHNGRVYRVGMFGGAGLNTLVPEKYDFDNPREAYFASIERLKREKVDVFIGNHTWNNDTYNKSLKLLKTGENEFIDSTLWQRFLESCEARLCELIKKEA